MPSWCTNWWCDQWKTGVNFILAIPAHFSILVNTGQGIGTEPCLLDTMFPLDHSNFDSGAESSRFTIPYTIRISMHLHTCCSSRWIEICIVIIFYEILVWSSWFCLFPHTSSPHTFQAWLYWGKMCEVWKRNCCTPSDSVGLVLSCAFFSWCISHFITG